MRIERGDWNAFVLLVMNNSAIILAASTGLEHVLTAPFAGAAQDEARAVAQTLVYRKEMQERLWEEKKE